MSKIGKRPIKIDEGVEVKIERNIISAVCSGKELSLEIPKMVSAKIEDGQVLVSRKDDEKVSRSMHGLYARLIANIITGVKSGFTRILEFKGTGYRAQVENNQLVLWMGYSHEIKLDIPAGLEAKVVKNTITISGMEKQRVGQFAAIVRKVRPPEVYKGKGIKYKEEVIHRKAGKTAASK
ncbi:MAG: 50S ribosomal protein L6 [Candidatus Berkelbacteria bacterium]